MRGPIERFFLEGQDGQEVIVLERCTGDPGKALVLLPNNRLTPYAYVVGLDVANRTWASGSYKSDLQTALDKFKCLGN